MLPNDIIYIIFTFDASHRERFSPCLRAIRLKDIPTKAIIKRIEYMNVHLWNPELNHIDAIWKEHIEDPGFFAKKLAKCNCCERHINGRPKNIDTWGDSKSTGDFTDHDVTFNYCQCPCRHNLRWLIRVFNPQKARYFNDDDFNDYFDY